MKKAFVVAAVLAFATVASAQYTIELDYDGTVGNGPDAVLDAVVSTNISVDVWILGSTPVLSYGADICNNSGTLDFVSYTSNAPAGWTDNSVTGNYPPCLTVQATDFSLTAPVAVPYMMGTLVFHVAQCGPADLTVISGGFFSSGFGQGSISNLIGLEFVACESATEESSWGAVKGLFR